MTNFRRYNQDHAANSELATALKSDLARSKTALEVTLNLLKQAQDALKHASVLPTDYSSTLSGIPRAKYDIHSAISHVSKRLEELEIEGADLDSYISVVAGFMTETEVRDKLREHE